MLTVIHPAREWRLRRDQSVLDQGQVDIGKFHTGIGSLDLLRALRSSRQRQRPLALNLQWPAGLVADAYLGALEQEIHLVGCHAGGRQPVDQFHLGGATPAIADLQRVMTHLRSRLHFLDHDQGDYSLDLDPLHTDWATMGLLRDLGFNHINIGVPDASAEATPSVAGYQDPAPIQSLIDAARTFGFRSVNVDLGYGHAWQTCESFETKLASLIALEPDRLQVFDYARAPRRYQQQPRRALSSNADKCGMRRIAFLRLEDAGYHYIGLGQFVRPDDDLALAQERGHLSRNCQGFTRHGYCDHIGFGLGAISQLDTLYAQNTDDLALYCQQLGSDLLPTARGWRCEAGDQIRQHVMERLACDLELDILALERRYGVIFSRYFSAIWPLLEHLHQDGLIDLSERFLCVLPAGRHRVEALCALFDRAGSAVPPCSNDETIDHESV
ncbi:coproporphyrinogen III oxidase [Pseudomonas proteolytica]|uniref:coproporphyrinogen III oxidase n=1 Tax=Pseudomonas proteolytica TaxID=219574 RepID=UPI001472D9CD|nr:coproporphyrinogen III oxidase [Pseudomonas proteolytica]NMZ25392.1 coproporphyrinogen III oxidase [Pseudomonas proteolytica]